MNWTNHAACAGLDPDMWCEEPAHPDAITICREMCPVATECLEAALDAREPAGLWGGLNTTQRDRILRRRGRLAVGTRPLKPIDWTTVAACRANGESLSAAAREVGVWVGTLQNRAISEGYAHLLEEVTP